jgi:hypothetical protein
VPDDVAYLVTAQAASRCWAPHRPTRLINVRKTRAMSSTSAPEEFGIIFTIRVKAQDSLDIVRMSWSNFCPSTRTPPPTIQQK